MRKALTLIILLTLISPSYALRRKKKKKQEKPKTVQTETPGGVTQEELALLRADFNQLQEKIRALEEALKECQNTNSEAMQKIEALRLRVKALEEQVDELRLRLKTSAKGQSTVGDSLSREELYKKGFDAFIAGRYEEAITYFRQFVNRFPREKETASALFWCGESYFRMNNFVAAASFYEKVYNIFPESQKAATALYRLIQCYKKMGKESKAKKYEKELLRKYPNSEEANFVRRGEF